MSFSRLSMPVVAVVLIAVWAGPCAGASLYVSPTGDDSNPGTMARPFATIARAQSAVRELKGGRGLTEPVVVNLRGGTYSLRAPLVFTPADSGRAGCPVTYRSHPGETAVISGGRRLKGFTKSGKLRTITLDDVKAGRWAFNQLYVNGRRRPRARTPNAGKYFRVHSHLGTKQEANRGFRFGRGDVEQWQNLDDVVFVVLASWYNTIHHVQELDMANRVVRFTNRAGRPFSWYEKNLRYYVENVAEALDQPGEWYLNRGTGKLTYYPLPGEKIDRVEVVAPVVKQTLVRLQGEPSAGLYVEHIHLRDLQIRHTDAHLPKDLYDARQAATVQDAGVLADAARHCVVEGCEVANMGEHGIWFRDDCQHNAVRRCHVHDLGGGGVYIGEKWRWGNDCPGWPGYRQYEDIPHFTEHNVVDNCFVHDGCHLFTGAIGVWVGQASHTTVSHNDICDVSYSGVSVGWDWSGHKSTAHHNVIEHNHIHHIGHGRMNDMAGIYTLGLSPGTVLRGNVIHDVEAYQSSVGYCLGAGIYHDQSSGEITVENNVCYSIANAGFFLHHGTSNRLVNNVFANLRGMGRLGWGMYFTARKGAADKGNVATRNIVHANTTKAAKATLATKKGRDGGAYDFVSIDGNVYHSKVEAGPAFSTTHNDAPAGILDIAKWREAGYDGRSVVADPLFVDAAKHDYRLKPNSPALALGIRSIDTSKAGLYGDESWVALPRSAEFRPADAPSPFTARVLLVLNEDYEDKPVGHVPGSVNFTDKEKGAVVEVTDTQAADGKKCLRFVDAPGLKAIYHPNRTWRTLRMSKGSVAVSFDCMNSRERPATFWIELRDWTAKPYKPGPSMTILPEGKLSIGKVRQLPFEPGRWYHVEIAFELGEDAPKTYQLRVAPKGEPLGAMTVPFSDGGFKTLTWLGFVAMDNDRHSEFYVDNLRVDME